MKTLKALACALALAATPLAAQAGDMSYSYVELGWVKFKPDGDDGDDGIGVRGSIGFAEKFFGFAEFAEFPRGSAFDLNLYAVGVGGHYGISGNADFVGRVGLLRAEANNLHDNGVLASVGVRGRLADAVEFEVHANYTDFGDTDNGDIELALGARYFFTDRFAVGAEFRAGDDAKTMFAGVRFAF